MGINRRIFLQAAFALLPLTGQIAHAGDDTLYVAKSPYCGCCGAWVEHMRGSGFEVVVNDLEQDDLNALKSKLGITPEISSCHTARIGEYVIEGHVPAGDVRRLMSERPDALGLAVPGMPIGSPGMEMGSEREPYDTLIIGAQGTASVFQSHR